jgi:CRP-like cAMP-binding protein
MDEPLLLAALPAHELDRLSRHLEPVVLEFEHVLIEPDQPIQHVWFPVDCVTSTIITMENGAAIEVGIMGNEGLVGIQLFLGEERTNSQTLVQVAGRALRMRAADFRREVMERPGPLAPLIGRYVHAFLAQVSQTAACNRLHETDERLSRWLLMIHNRVQTDEFSLTHEFLASMLNAGRPRVSTAAKVLQRAGLIDYARGKIRILDREGLEASTCECYGIIQKLFDRLYESTR